MSGIATAIVSAAVITGVGVDIASQKAASATQSASQTAAQVQMAALQQQAQLAAPYTALGQSAMPTYQALLGIGGGPGGGAPGIRGPGARGGGVGGYTPSAGGAPGGPGGIQSTLANLPGYQFTLGQGLGQTEAAASALYGGGGGGGNLLQGIDQYTTGLAQQNYQQYLNDLLQPIQIGQAAAAGQAANIGSAASNLSNIATNQGNTLAGIQANEVAGMTRAASGGINNYLTYQTLQNLQGNQYAVPGGTGAPYNLPGGGWVPPDVAPPGQV